MKKYILMFVMFFLSTVLVFTACANKNVAVEEVPEDEEEIEIEAEDDEPITEEEPINTSSEEIGDTGIESLFVTELDTTNSHIYLKRDDRYYTLDARPILHSPVTGVRLDDGKNVTYSDAFDTTTFPNGRKGFYSYGDVPVPILSTDDQVISYHPRGEMLLKLAKVDFYGYALSMDLISIHSDRYEIHYFDDWNTYKIILELGVTDPVVKDRDGNIVEDYYDLTQSTSYELSWYSNTDGGYKSKDLYSQSKAFIFQSGFEFQDEQYDYIIDGASDSSGYSSYDLSSVAPGIYKVYGDKCGGGVIVIK